MKKVILYFLLVLTISSEVTAQVKVYKGTSTYSSDVICTIDDGKVYKKIYKGTSSYTSDILATIEANKVYSGTSSYTSDIEFTFNGNLTIEEFVAVWYAVKYCY